MAGMRRRTGRLEVSGPAGLARGITLQVDVGDDAEMVQVLGVRGTTAKVGRWEDGWRGTMAG
jgi:hypothetical protein